MSNSTTKYRHYTDEELLNLLSALAGRSPVIDELAIRLEAAGDAEQYVKETDAAQEQLERDVDNALDKAQEIFNSNMDLVRALATSCSVCEAQIAQVLPEFDDIADCLNIRREE